VRETEVREVSRAEGMELGKGIWILFIAYKGKLRQKRTTLAQGHMVD
jgi:hypothetical protein